MEPPFSGGLRVTDLERTVVDCIKDFEKIGGLEELRDNLASIQSLDETALLKYLDLYDNQFLYQKAGFLLQQENEHLHLSPRFYQACLNHVGQSKRYLLKESKNGFYDAKWRLVLPGCLKGVSADVTI